MNRIDAAIDLLNRVACVAIIKTLARCCEGKSGGGGGVKKLTKKNKAKEKGKKKVNSTQGDSAMDVDVENYEAGSKEDAEEIEINRVVALEEIGRNAEERRYILHGKVDTKKYHERWKLEDTSAAEYYVT